MKTLMKIDLFRGSGGAKPGVSGGLRFPGPPPTYKESQTKKDKEEQNKNKLPEIEPPE